MAKNEFREDLYYRLNVVNLKIPALNERAEDIPLLANHLLREAAQRHKPFVRSSTDAMKRLMTASWPGNVRQLVNVIEQCVALTSAPVISEALVEQALEGENTALPTFAEARNQFELHYLRKLLQITKGNVTRPRAWRAATAPSFTNCCRATNWTPTILKNDSLPPAPATQVLNKSGGMIYTPFLPRRAPA